LSSRVKKDIRTGQLIYRTIMPLPKPKPTESQSEFVARCVSDPVMEREFPNMDQRLVICYVQFKTKNGKPNR
jgi:hypothetical protein